MAKDSTKKTRFNFKEDIKILETGDTSLFTNSMLTSIQNNIDHLKEKSSDEYKDMDFDIRNLNKTKSVFLKRMLNEWKLKVSNNFGILDMNNIKISNSDDELFECEICKSKNKNAKGAYTCKSVYRCINEKTNKSLWIGSQCLKKFDIDVYYAGNKCKDSEKVIRDIEKTYKELETTDKLEVVEFCYENSLRMLESMNTLNPSNKSIKEALDFYNKKMKTYVPMLYSAYLAESNKNIEVDKHEMDEYFDMLYRMCKNMCDIGYYIFTPSYKLVMGRSTFDGVFKIITSYIMSIRYYNKVNNIENPLEGLDFDYLKEFIKKLDVEKISERALRTEIDDYAIRYNRISESIMFAVLILLMYKGNDMDNTDNKLVYNVGRFKFNIKVKNEDGKKVKKTIIFSEEFNKILNKYYKKGFIPEEIDHDIEDFFELIYLDNKKPTKRKSTKRINKNKYA